MFFKPIRLLPRTWVELKLHSPHVNDKQASHTENIHLYFFSASCDISPKQNLFCNQEGKKKPSNQKCIHLITLDTRTQMFILIIFTINNILYLINPSLWLTQRCHSHCVCECTAGQPTTQCNTPAQAGPAHPPVAPPLAVFEEHHADPAAAVAKEQWVVQAGFGAL